MAPPAGYHEYQALARTTTSPTQIKHILALALLRMQSLEGELAKQKADKQRANSKPVTAEKERDHFAAEARRLGAWRGTEDPAREVMQCDSLQNLSNFENHEQERRALVTEVTKTLAERTTGDMTEVKTVTSHAKLLLALYSSRGDYKPMQVAIEELARTRSGGPKAFELFVALFAKYKSVTIGSGCAYEDYGLRRHMTSFDRFLGCALLLKHTNELRTYPQDRRLEAAEMLTVMRLVAEIYQRPFEDLLPASIALLEAAAHSQLAYMLVTRVADGRLPQELVDRVQDLVFPASVFRAAVSRVTDLDAARQ